jgi:hypothetical protein
MFQAARRGGLTSLARCRRIHDESFWAHSRPTTRMWP